MKSWNLGRAAALVAAGTLAASGAFAQNLPARIKIGSSQPLSGPTALNGQTARMVQEMTIKEINAAGGMGGRPVDLVFGDDQGDPTHAVTEVRRLVDQEKINVLIGPGVANVALASAPIVTPAKILSFPFTGAKSITVQNFPYGFATFYPSDAFAEAMVNYAIDKLGAKNIAIMADTGAQGRAAADTAKDYIPKRGGRVTGIEYADFDAQDYTPQVLNLKRGNPDVVLQVTSVQIGAGRFYLATEEQNWPVRIVSQVSSLFPEEIKKIAGANAYGARRMHGLTVKAVTMCPGEDPSRLPFVQFRDKLKAFTPDWQKIPLAIAPYYYDEMYITKAAVDATRSVDGPTLASWIEKNGGSVKGLILGPPTASATDHFLYHSEVFAFTVRPDQVNAQGVAVREGC